MRTISQDLRFAVRLLWKSPGFTLVAVAALALGIGANTAIFSVVNSILFRPLPYRDPGRVMNVFETNLSRGWNHVTLSGSNYLDWKEQSRLFEDMAAMERGSATITGMGEPEQVPGMRVTTNFFDLLGTRAFLGRTFTPEEGHGGRRNVVVISYGWWMRRFGGDPRVIGKQFIGDGIPYTLIGVLPKGFYSPIPAELFVPWPEEELRQKPRTARALDIIGRLKPGVSVRQAAAELTAIETRLARTYPVMLGWGAGVLPLQDVLVQSIRPALLVLLAAVGFVLLIACANIANLLLARGAKREREVAIRTAVGAGRGRIVRQFLTESVSLGLAGGAAGLLLALWGVDFLQRVVPADIGGGRGLILRPVIAIDLRVLLFTVVISLVTGIIFGLAPALAAARPSVNDILKEGGRMPSPSRRRLRDLFVISEVALALVLLICAGLTIKSFLRMRQVDPGFRPDHVLTMELELPTDTRYRTATEQASFFHRLLERVSQLPGVKDAGITYVLPLDENNANASLLVEGAPPLPPGERLAADYRAVSAGYFTSMGVPLRRGRFFEERDREGAPLVVIVDETLAHRYLLPGRDPVGQRIRLGNTLFQVVGVVGAVRHSGLNLAPTPTVYTHYLQEPENRMDLVVRTAADPASIIRTVKNAVYAIDRDQPVYKVRPMRQVVEESTASERLTLALLALFAGVALALAAIGIYGVMSYSVAQRVHEIGIRMALGAGTSTVLRLVVRQGMQLTAFGVAAGLALALVATRVLASLLYGISRNDPAIFAGTSLMLAAVALGASYIPARRATRVDPLISLRYE